ncbi:MAG: Nif3-like dinuclear metal center hexameric protein [Nitrosomonas sp.]|nr:Nif3-like dinuclear metal center hexameric protein [Nitrosomonas sp.]MCC7135143.1 Nif3-like dinuclear metal center hexameric protein [Nitrosomonas sp.]
MHQKTLEDYLNTMLEIARFRDYCPNGLQVEGRAQIQTIVTGVTASQALISRAIELQADAIIVHHGYFWRGENACLRGIKRQRIAALIKHDINLFAYHLPLDAHIELGNNAQLAKKLNIAVEGSFGEQALALQGSFETPLTLGELNTELTQLLARQPLIIGDLSKSIRRIAWCSGAAQDMFEAATNLEIDAYLTGEISEQNVHTARETGIAFISAGHHATERYGIQALGKHIAEQFNLCHYFVDVENPV